MELSNITKRLVWLNISADQRAILGQYMNEKQTKLCCSSNLSSSLKPWAGHLGIAELFLGAWVSIILPTVDKPLEDSQDIVQAMHLTLHPIRNGGSSTAAEDRPLQPRDRAPFSDACPNTTYSASGPSQLNFCLSSARRLRFSSSST